MKRTRTNYERQPGITELGALGCGCALTAILFFAIKIILVVALVALALDMLGLVEAYDFV